MLFLVIFQCVNEILPRGEFAEPYQKICYMVVCLLQFLDENWMPNNLAS